MRHFSAAGGTTPTTQNPYNNGTTPTIAGNGGTPGVSSGLTPPFPDSSKAFSGSMIPTILVPFSFLVVLTLNFQAIQVCLARVDLPIGWRRGLFSFVRSLAFFICHPIWLYKIPFDLLNCFLDSLKGSSQRPPSWFKPCRPHHSIQQFEYWDCSMTISSQSAKHFPYTAQFKCLSLNHCL